MNVQNESERRSYLTDWARTLEKAAARGVFGRPVALRDAQLVNGPRAGAIEVDAGLDAPILLKSLQASECAMMRQFVPWDFAGDPLVFMAGRRVRLEAGWPKGLGEDDIPLRALGQHPAGGGRWLVGRTERGHVLTAGLSDSTAHWLVAGTTGSGKTTALVSAIGQLCRDPDNRLVLVDAKHGASFRPLAGVRGLVGPLACDVYEARAALAWCVGEMTRRYSGGRDDRRVIVFIDEVQELANDNQAAESLRRLVAQGRGCGVHAVVATQHPVVSSLGDPTVRRNLTGRLALLVTDAESSRVAVGGATPRADRLLGRGDSYALAPGATHRVQVAYLDGRTETGDPELEAWPEDLGDLPDNSGWPSGAEVGAGLLSATRGDGRVRFQRYCEEWGIHVGGNDKAVKLLALARDTIEWLGDHDASVRPDAEMHTKSSKTRRKSAKSVYTEGRTDGREDNDNEA
ncbi:MAG: AAA family ATPase [Thermoflexales bacterium]|nr:AAA family ATPase [Thermoflexales bacterium]